MTSFWPCLGLRKVPSQMTQRKYFSWEKLLSSTNFPFAVPHQLDLQSFSTLSLNHTLGLKLITSQGLSAMVQTKKSFGEKPIFSVTVFVCFFDTSHWRSKFLSLTIFPVLILALGLVSAEAPLLGRSIQGRCLFVTFPWQKVLDKTNKTGAHPIH